MTRDDDRCPTCGTSHREAIAPLVAACDVLVLRALELVGKRTVKVDRSRYERRGDTPWHRVHLLWQPEQHQVEKALESAWEQVPFVVIEHGCCGATPPQVRRVLDRYVRDLCQMMTGHDVRELRYRLAAFLGVDLGDEAEVMEHG